MPSLFQFVVDQKETFPRAFVFISKSLFIDAEFEPPRADRFCALQAHFFLWLITEGKKIKSFVITFSRDVFFFKTAFSRTFLMLN